MGKGRGGTAARTGLELAEAGEDPVRRAVDDLLGLEVIQGRQVALLGVVGSQAYGLVRVTSDVDLRGVYVAETKQLLGLPYTHEFLKQHPHRPDLPYEQIGLDEPDVVVWELGKFCQLGLKANPSVLELCPDYRATARACQCRERFPAGTLRPQGPVMIPAVA